MGRLRQSVRIRSDQRGPGLTHVGRELQRWAVHGWSGMYDSRSPMAEREGEATILINWLPLDEERGGDLVLRAGMQRLTTPTTVRLATNLAWQGVGAFFLGAIATYWVIIAAGGQLYSLNILTGDLSLRISTANLTAAGITLSSTGRIHLVQFGTQLIVADSNNNVPFAWDGTAGAGLTKLTNVPTAHEGPPVVYYGKLFWIKSGTNTIIWSEENQPNIGYEAGGYNNAWDLTQTGQGARVHGLLATNDGLYYFRHQSVGVIRGAVSTTFQSDGVHDSISQETGIFLSVDPLWLADAVWWIGGDGHPMVYRPGAGVVDLGLQVSRRFGTAEGMSSPETAYLGNWGEEYAANIATGAGMVLADRGNNRVHFEYAGGGRRSVLIFDALSLRLLAVHSYPAVNTPTTFLPWAAIVAWSGASWPTIMNKIYCDSAGYIFREPTAFVPQQGFGGPIGYDETHNGAGSPVEGILIGPMHGYSASVEYQFTQLNVLGEALPNNAMSVGYITSRFHKKSLAPAAQNIGADTASNTPYERKKSFGLATSGRWLRPIISVSGEATANRLPRLHGYELEGYPISTAPSVT